MISRVVPQRSRWVSFATGLGLATFTSATTAESESPGATPSRPQRFLGKTIVITGAAGTFGAAGTKYFLSEGANVVLIDKSPAFFDWAMTEALRSDSPAGLGKTLACVCDVTDQEKVNEALSLVKETFGGIDLCWNNAGYQGLMKPLLDHPADDVKKVLEVNVLGAFHVLQGVARIMAEGHKGGAIVQTGSVAGMEGTPTMAGYVASKAGIHGLTMTAAKDLAPFRIRVNTVSPALIGPHDAYMWKRQNELHASSGSPYYSRDAEQVAKDVLDAVPMKRLGTPEEVVATVAFLLSNEASYITGINVPIAGGASP